MMWYLLNPARLQSELEGIATLADAAPWLEIANWRIGDSMRLECMAQIRTPTRDYDVTLTYGAGFPDTPPSVLPRGANERWSTHQFGARGELCLEYGPDNWLSSISGAMLLKSAHRLLETEAPVAPGAAMLPSVDSRHALTLGQETRPKHFRMSFSPAFAEKVGTTLGSAAARFSVRNVEDTWMSVPFAFAVSGESEWTDRSVPPVERGARQHAGFVRFDADAVITSGAEALRRSILTGSNPPVADVEWFLLRQHGNWRAFLTFADSDVVEELVVLPPKPAPRLSPEYAVLSNDMVGLVGAGSVGSKVATMLVRAGVRRFEILDDDVLQQENLVRNELDWSDVGLHKVHALRQRLLRVRPDAEVRVRNLRLGGQESAGAVDAAVLALSQCDLIIDATASGDAFNLIAAAGRLGSKPVVWAEVFAGGIGGVIARSRPGLDPSPQIARAVLAKWYADRETPFPAESPAQYELNQNGSPLIADDADVSVIAAHFGRLAIDTLLAKPESAFPVSAYVIGLRKAWIFEQPFDVWPVDLGPATEVEAPPHDSTLTERGIASLLALIQARSDTASAA